MLSSSLHFEPFSLLSSPSVSPFRNKPQPRRPSVYFFPTCRCEAMAMCYAVPAAHGRLSAAAEREALVDLRTRLQTAIQSRPGLFPGDEAATLWGVPLLPSKGHDATDGLLLKFLRARGFDSLAALHLLMVTVQWRREFGVDGVLLDEDLRLGLLEECTDREGRPVCYSVLTDGGDEVVRWRVQVMEKGVRRLTFKPGGVSSMVQVTDLRTTSAVRPRRKEELRRATALALFQEQRYPELLDKIIFINVSLRDYAYLALFSNLISPRSRSKFVFARPSNVTKTLLKNIAAEKLPVQFGGLKQENDEEFTVDDAALEFTIKSGCTKKIQIPVAEEGVTVVWDLSVVGWEVIYKEEFIPVDEGSYTILIHEDKKPYQPIRNSFYINEPGRVVLTIENRGFNKKKILYRSKSKPTIPLYTMLRQTHTPPV